MANLSLAGRITQHGPNEFWVRVSVRAADGEILETPIRRVARCATRYDAEVLRDRIVAELLLQARGRGDEVIAFDLS